MLYIFQRKTIWERLLFPKAPLSINIHLPKTQSVAMTTIVTSVLILEDKEKYECLIRKKMTKVILTNPKSVGAKWLNYLNENCKWILNIKLSTRL